MIRRHPLPSGDLVVTLLNESGKWRAVARKGALPGGNLGRLSLFHDVTVQQYQKRDGELALLTQVTLNGALPRLSAPTIYPYAHLLAELADELTVDVHLGERIFEYLASGLRGLNRHSDPELVALLYSWRLLEVAGLAPRVNSCAGCGEAAELLSFGAASGGLTCANCAVGVNTPLSGAAVQEFRLVASGPLRTALASPPNDRSLMWRLLERYVAYHVRSLRSFGAPGTFGLSSGALTAGAANGQGAEELAQDANSAPLPPHA